MAVGSNAFLEPLLIIGLFTIGCLINRRTTHTSRAYDVENNHFLPKDDPHGISSGTSSSATSPSLNPVEPSLRARKNIFWDLLSRFWNKYPFLPEIWYWNLTYWVYQGFRAISARTIAGNRAIFERAMNHAIQILHLEQRLGIAVEISIQRFFLNNYPDLFPFLAQVYYAHICVGVAFLVYTYTYVPHATYFRIRRTIAVDNMLAFVVLTLWRCSPPRLLPAEYGYEDVLHPKTNPNDNPWQNNRFQLTIAAMPSLHFGTALFLAVCLFRFAPHGFVRWVGLVWPAAMLLTILSTANHFLLDAVVGMMIPLVGWRLEYLVGRLAGFQAWVFGPVRRRMWIEVEGAKVMVD